MKTFGFEDFVISPMKTYAFLFIMSGSYTQVLALTKKNSHMRRQHQAQHTIDIISSLPIALPTETAHTILKLCMIGVCFFGGLRNMFGDE